ncbi:Cof-type HAD-IIB family hydrolase [Dermabacteraceae bacterium TAE3-ERU5]|nr:Cof-type HAD-IIB family hydrolase [Dermabacteraceae bacterium TAE3-ERU5]
MANDMLRELALASAKAPHIAGVDVDGTLVDHQGNMTDRVREALQRAANSGHHLVVSTGRSVGATLPIVRTAGLETGHVVCSNGGVTLRLDANAEGGYLVIDRQTFFPAEAIDQLANVGHDVHFGVETDTGAIYTTPGFTDSSFGTETIESDLEHMRSLTAVRLVVCAPSLTTEEFDRVVHASGLSGVSFSVGWSAWLEIAGQGVSKATALESVREHLAVPGENTVAVGDGSNDIEMLRWARYGFAMGQADEDVKEAADAATATVWDDGAALVLDALTELA